MAIINVRPIQLTSYFTCSLARSPRDSPNVTGRLPCLFYDLGVEGRLNSFTVNLEPNVALFRACLGIYGANSGQQQNERTYRKQI